ncbi:MAG: TIGR02186 family protein [Parvularculales bacterium]
MLLVRCGLFATVLFISLAMAGGGGVRGQGLVTDLSERLISVYPSFSGAEILIFGAVEAPLGDVVREGGDFSWGAMAERDIVIVVRGPQKPVIVRRKSLFAGIWVNTDSVVFDKIPGYYAVMSTRPLEAIASPVALQRYAIGMNHLPLDSGALLPERNTENPNSENLRPWTNAIVQSNKEQGLYTETSGNITLLGNTVFHATLNLPANVPVGNYVTEVYMLRDGVVVDAQSSPLYVSKAGFERAIFRLAYQWPLLYGIGAVLIALVAGWLASVVFNRP